MFVVDGRVKPGQDAFMSGPPFKNWADQKAIPIRAGLCLDKIRNLRYMFLIAESPPARSTSRAARVFRLFESCLNHNPPRESGARKFFLLFSAVTH